MSAKCYTHYMHLVKVDGTTKHDIFVPVRCKSWGCESCRSIKAKIVKDFIRRSFAGCKVTMLTFTDPHKGDVLEAWRTLGSRWNLFRTWAVKTYGKFQYVRVIEPHKMGGWPHMHVLVNVKMSEPRIRAMLKKWNYGYIFDKMEISVEGASQYVSGYLTKKWPGQQANALRRTTKTRIVQASQSLGPIFSKASDWKLVSREVQTDDVEGYSWDVYKERFLNHRNGALYKRFSECFAIESCATSADIEEFREMLDQSSAVSVEDVEEPSLEMVGVQQSLFLKWV